MEELIGLLGFSIGASLGAGAMRTLGDGSRPVVREVMKAGLRAWDGVVTASTAARDAVGHVQDEAEAERAARVRARRGAQPRKIIVARD